MRPHRLPRCQQHSYQRYQEEGNHDQSNYYEYNQISTENHPASLRFTRDWYHGPQGHDLWQSADVYSRQRTRGYVPDISHGYADSSLRWTEHHNHDGYRQWHSARHSGNRAPIYNSSINERNVFSRDRNCLETRIHHRHTSRVSNNGRQIQSYCSSAVTFSTPSDAANDAVVEQISTQSFHPGSREYSNVRRRADPTHLSRERKLGPSEEYLKISAEKSETLRGAAKGLGGLVRKLLVLDLNGTLVYRSPHRSWRDRYPGSGDAVAATTVKDGHPQSDPSQLRPIRVTHLRPYLTPFRDYLFHPSTKQWLDTMVWSSAQPRNVNDMVEKCFGDMKGELVEVWARDRLGLAAGDYSRKVQTTKDLNKPWNELNSIPLVSSKVSKSMSLQRNHSAKTTLLLDDSPLKAHLQPYNHLCLKEYDIRMQKHDMSVRELEVAQEQLPNIISGKRTIEEVFYKTEVEDDHDPAKESPQEDLVLLANARKRKRKENKENKKKVRIEQWMHILDKERGTLSYDKTLLAVIGILDATKRETNVAAWIRSGGLIQSLVEQDYSEVGRGSVRSDEAIESLKEMEASNKKGEDEKQFLEHEPTDGVSLVDSKQAPLPPREEDDRCVEGTNDVQNQLWFNHPEVEAFWVSRGEKALEVLEIDIISGVI